MWISMKDCLRTCFLGGGVLRKTKKSMLCQNLEAVAGVSHDPLKTVQEQIKSQHVQKNWIIADQSDSALTSPEDFTCTGAETN